MEGVEINLNEKYIMIVGFLCNDDKLNYLSIL